MKGFQAATLLVLAGLYAPAITAMAHIWWNNSYNGHGMFVPLFSALTAWIDRDGLRAAAAPGRPAGLVLVLAGLALLAVGHGAQDLLVQGLSIPVTVAGLVWWIFGAACLRRATFPVWFLALMAPLPRAAVDAVTLDLQLFSAGAAGVVLRFLGIPIHQSGVLIELPALTLQVAEVCNGLRFLMAFLVLAAAFAQVTQRTVLRKVVLTASAVPIAIVANAMRVAALALGVYFIGPQASHGAIHDWIGKSVHVLTLIPLLLLGYLLTRVRPSRA